MTPCPKISVVTINLNNIAGLQKTIDSVFKQTFPGYEYIVIDGGSTDGSKDIIERNVDKLAYWISEKDTGVYNAMNKAIQKAQGEYLLFMNSGDYLVSERILEKFAPFLIDKDIVYGNLIIKEALKEWEKKYPENPSFEYFIYDTIPHSGAGFIKKELFNKIGLYDESIYITADWKFYMDAIFKQGATTKYIDEAVSVFAFDGISSRPENGRLLEQEKQKVLENDYPKFIASYRELEKLKKLKEFYESVSKDFFIRKYLAGMLKARVITRRFKKFIKKPFK